MKKGTVLLAEDNLLVRSAIKDMLEHLQYSVIEAIDGEHAIRKFEENQDGIDLILLDIVMPGKNGKEVSAAIRRVVPGIKIMFMSGYIDEQFKPDEMAKEHFLPKPFSFLDLDAKINAIM